MADRITGRLDDGTVFIHSETGNEGVGYFTTQRRLPEICCKIANLEDKIENGELVEVVHGEWLDAQYTYFGAKRYECSVCRDDEFWGKRYIEIKENYCPNCGAKMDKSKRK